MNVAYRFLMDDAIVPKTQLFADVVCEISRVYLELTLTFPRRAVFHFLCTAMRLLLPLTQLRTTAPANLPFLRGDVRTFYLDMLITMPYPADVHSIRLD